VISAESANHEIGLPPASVKTAVKKSAKLPVEIPSAGQREVQGIESNTEAKESQSE
jgi:hypothetical protein